jgi:hypothetical protein
MKDVNKKLMDKFANDKKNSKTIKDENAKNDEFNRRKEFSKNFNQVRNFI